MFRLEPYSSSLRPLLARVTIAELSLLAWILFASTIESAVWQSDPCHLLSHGVCKESVWPLVVVGSILILTLTHLLTTLYSARAAYLGHRADQAFDLRKDLIKFSLGIGAFSVAALLIWTLILMPPVAGILMVIIRRIEYIYY